MTSTQRMRALVVGGGPAGTTAATAMAHAGLDVRLVEAATFPRYHIGESLTPSCHAVLEVIGVAGKANGVRVTTGHASRSVRFDGDRPVGVAFRPETGDEYELSDFDFLIDATGRHGLLSNRHFADRRPLQNLRNVAIWDYWTGTTMPARRADRGRRVRRVHPGGDRLLVHRRPLLRPRLRDRLCDEALRAQVRSVEDPAAARPDFTSVLGNPLDDAESADFRLVTTPWPGLGRVRG